MHNRFCWSFDGIFAAGEGNFIYWQIWQANSVESPFTRRNLSCKISQKCYEWRPANARQREWKSNPTNRKRDIDEMPFSEWKKIETQGTWTKITERKNPIIIYDAYNSFSFIVIVWLCLCLCSCVFVVFVAVAAWLKIKMTWMKHWIFLILFIIIF